MLLEPKNPLCKSGLPSLALRHGSDLLPPPQAGAEETRMEQTCHSSLRWNDEREIAVNQPQKRARPVSRWIKSDWG